MDTLVEQIPFLGTKIVQKHRRNTEGRTITMPMYIYIFFQHREKKWHRISFILYLIWLVHFSTTHTHICTHVVTHSWRTLSPARESRKHSEDDDRNEVTDRFALWWFRLSRDRVYCYCGWILYEGRKAPQLTVFENKMARHQRDMPSLLFFSNTKTKNKKINMATVKFDWKIVNDKY